MSFLWQERRETERFSSPHQHQIAQQRHKLTIRSVYVFRFVRIDSRRRFMMIQVAQLQRIFGQVEEKKRCVGENAFNKCKWTTNSSRERVTQSTHSNQYSSGGKTPSCREFKLLCESLGKLIGELLDPLLKFVQTKEATLPVLRCSSFGAFYYIFPYLHDN